MASLSGVAGFTGSFGDVSIYKMRGVDKLVVRQKGGATRDRIRRDRNFFCPESPRRPTRKRSQLSLVFESIVRMIKSTARINK